MLIKRGLVIERADGSTDLITEGDFFILTLKNNDQHGGRLLYNSDITFTVPGGSVSADDIENIRVLAD